jgi:hypothetical protein
MRKIRKSGKLVYGVGINDADYTVQPTINGEVVWCPYYMVWRNMLMRCYSETLHKTHPTYTDCTVCDEWKYFMTFRAWMMTQDWEGKCLDKDFLISGNKVYSPYSCAFIDNKINSFINDHGNRRGDYPLGVTFHTSGGRFVARINQSGNRKHLGLFDCPLEAHKHWQQAKLKLAIDLLLTLGEIDSRIREGITRIINKLRSDINMSRKTGRL